MCKTVQKKHSSLKQMLFVIERLNIAVNDFVIYAQSVLTFHTLCRIDFLRHPRPDSFLQDSMKCKHKRKMNPVS